MDTNGGCTLTTVIFFFFFFFFITISDCSTASSSSLVWRFRKLVDADPKNESTTNTDTQNSTLPSPDFSGNNVTNPTPLYSGNDLHPQNNSIIQNPIASTNIHNTNRSNINTAAVTVTTTTIVKHKEQKSHEAKDKIDDTTKSKSKSKSGTNASCDGSPTRCNHNAMVACILGFQIGSKDLVLIVQNERESTLKVKIAIPTSTKNAMTKHQIPKHQSEREKAARERKTSRSLLDLRRIKIPDKLSQILNISLMCPEQGTKIVINAGDGDCVLDMGPSVYKGILFKLLPSYYYKYKPVTPFFAVYLLFVMVLIVGGIWGCCKLIRKKRRVESGGVAYQGLEMGLPESASAVNVTDTAEGWDEVWDDDWDEENAVKSPGGHHVGNISANGLISRSSNRDGWEDNWDD